MPLAPDAFPVCFWDQPDGQVRLDPDGYCEAHHCSILECPPASYDGDLVSVSADGDV